MKISQRTSEATVAQKYAGLDALEPSQLQNLTETIADILTIKVETAAHQINQQPEEALALYTVFVDGMKANGLNAREWRTNTMSLLPAKYWVGVTPRCGMPLNYVAPNDLASLKYLTQTEAVDAGHRQVRNREVLYKLIKAQVPSAILQQHDNLLAWKPLSLEAVSIYPNIGDGAALGLMHEIELLFYEIYRKQEEKARKETGVTDPLRSTPFYLIEEIARITSGIVQEAIFRNGWGFEDEDFQSIESFVLACGGPTEEENSLALDVLLNVTANRFLLERAKAQALAQKGLKINLNLINALNAKGIQAAPEITQHNYDIGHIRDILSNWFDSGIPNFTLKPDYLELCLEFGKQAQSHYLKTRGHHDTETHGSPYCYFLFTLALVACHFSEIQTTDEFSSGKFRDLVPGKSKGSRRTHPMPPGAQDMINSMYGQLFFGNYMHGLSAKGMSEYAKAFQVKHAHLQHLLFLIFKRSTVNNLQGLYDWLCPVKEPSGA